jgi:pimeloyl-ACP methyl ester carboxylesterase
MSTLAMLRHGKAKLALHTLRDGAGRPLLHLHGLGERSPAAVPDHLAAWPGPVVALDFTGHGDSTVPAGGGYTAEVLMADVDAAIEHLGSVTLFGRGLGAYVALLAAGARAEHVRGAILFDGPGLVGGGIRPGSPHLIPSGPVTGRTPDPLALAELARDVRPPDYAVEFVRQAREWSGLDWPIAVVSVLRPEWLAAVADEAGVATCTLAEALVRFAAVE